MWRVLQKAKQCTSQAKLQSDMMIHPDSESLGNLTPLLSGSVCRQRDGAYFAVETAPEAFQNCI